VTLALLGSASLEAGNFPDSAVPLPSGWNGPVFHLSQNYPSQIPADNYPWLRFDPRTQSSQYMRAVLQYCMDGNIQSDWVPQLNPQRGWYHAPWMHWGAHGREPIHGLTFERTSLPGELSPQQTKTLQNWAVGMYNSPGGYTIGRVWADPFHPKSGAAKFPANTVSIKLLFTEGDAAQVPFLVGSKVWPAYIYLNPQDTGPSAQRVVRPLSLLQVDIAVRDPRVASTTGWVFGTFIFDGRVQGSNPYTKLRPVGLMWGNDPNLGPAEYNQGARPVETKLYSPSRAIMRHYGWLLRLNGPVDNPKSSCLSCHSTAQWPVAVPLLPPSGVGEGSPQWMQWFRNIPAGTPFTATSISLDYSLQLAGGVQNLAAWSNACKANPKAPLVPPCPSVEGFRNSAGQSSRIKLGYPVRR
jgi:hypothetical protein